MKFEGHKQKSNSETIEISIVTNQPKPEPIEPVKIDVDGGKVNEEEKGERRAGEISDNSKKIKKKPKKSIRRRESQDLFESELEVNADFATPENTIQKFPLAVKVVLKKPNDQCMQNALQGLFDEIYPVELHFFLYPKLGLVTCTARTKETKPTSLNILHSLFSEDDGHFVIDHLLSDSIVWANEDERPYSWVNFLAGIFDFAFLNRQENKKEAYYYDPLEVNADSVAAKIHGRILSICALKYQTDYLFKNNQIPPEILSTISSQQQFKIVHDTTRIKEFSPTIQEFFILGATTKRAEYLQPSTALMAGLPKVTNEFPMMLPAFRRTEEGTFVKSYRDNADPCKYEVGHYFKMLLERGDFRVRGLVEIGCNYPHAVPNIVLTIESIKGNGNEKKVPELEGLEGANFGYSHVLREIEQELTRYWPEYCPEEEKLNLLSYQIKKLTTCLEIFAQTENEEATTLYKKGKKGVTRSRPFAYNPSENIYEQR
eukprot:TRINITY_DN467_c0_g1_i3.p1 TRINITY_DN467_c0_g1~~TRINITY_DN467_c0_g1_i3.p1  ORF type:complete len:487 (-),score=109.77 TRINITY_DN467_c0_g1_i3:44-1504(-)